jgi:hypothetical protein
MHCTACDAELILTNVVPENTVAVRGFEHHTFICSGCHSTVRRVAFMKHGPEGVFVHVLMRSWGGLLVATVLTLIFLPALYVACFRVKEPGIAA